ncbi:MAG: ABC transporter substrate-binding protein [Thermomicrobiales bacterium]
MSAARAVMQSGEADWAWNLQVEAAILESSNPAAKGYSYPGLEQAPRNSINHLIPKPSWITEVASRSSAPALSDPRVRQAIALATSARRHRERACTERRARPRLHNERVPAAMPDGITWEYDIEAANALLDEAGASPNDGGIRN